MKKEINWKEIQKFYDNNHTWKDINETFKISMSISKSRIKFLEKNPDKVPYLLNHYSKGESYPEKYFDKIFKKTNLQYIRYCTVNRYELDFAFVDKGIDLEIDGDQHYLDETIIKSDERRNIYLSKNGWEIIRIKWSNYQKLNRIQKKEYIKKLINYINTKKELPILPEINSIKYNLCECGNKKWYKSKSCKECSSKKQEKFNITKKELEKLLLTNSYQNLGRKFNVSGTSIRKRAKKYKLI
jgi:very-short-patch-repair endonuclease